MVVPPYCKQASPWFNLSTIGKPKETFTIHPQFLKQYNSHWFNRNRRPRIGLHLPLDRIIEFSKQDGTYITLDKDFETFFEDVVGVTIPRTQEKELMVEAKVDPKSIEYIKTKPLHESQTIIQNEPYTVLRVSSL